MSNEKGTNNRFFKIYSTAASRSSRPSFEVLPSSQPGSQFYPIIQSTSTQTIDGALVQCASLHMLAGTLTSTGPTLWFPHIITIRGGDAENKILDAKQAVQRLITSAKTLSSDGDLGPIRRTKKQKASEQAQPDEKGKGQEGDRQQAGQSKEQHEAGQSKGEQEGISKGQQEDGEQEGPSDGPQEDGQEGGLSNGQQEGISKGQQEDGEQEGPSEGQQEDGQEGGLSNGQQEDGQVGEVAHERQQKQKHAKKKQRESDMNSFHLGQRQELERLAREHGQKKQLKQQQQQQEPSGHQKQREGNGKKRDREETSAPSSHWKRTRETQPTGADSGKGDAGPSQAKSQPTGAESSKGDATPSQANSGSSSQSSEHGQANSGEDAASSGQGLARSGRSKATLGHTGSGSPPQGQATGYGVPQLTSEHSLSSEDSQSHKEGLSNSGGAEDVSDRGGPSNKGGQEGRSSEMDIDSNRASSGRSDGPVQRGRTPGAAVQDAVPQYTGVPTVPLPPVNEHPHDRSTPHRIRVLSQHLSKACTVYYKECHRLFLHRIRQDKGKLWEGSPPNP
eukprot:gene31917-7182_t